jgi:hypothetical protein
MMDDTDRQGEKDTKNDIIKLLQTKDISHHIGDYQGNKTLSVISTNKYKYTTSL